MIVEQSTVTTCAEAVYFKKKLLLNVLFDPKNDEKNPVLLTGFFMNYE